MVLWNDHDTVLGVGDMELDHIESHTNVYTSLVPRLSLVFCKVSKKRVGMAGNEAMYCIVSNK